MNNGPDVHALNGILRPAVQAEQFEYDQMLRRSLAGIPNVNFISLLDINCPGGHCTHFGASGWLILIDDSHLGVEASLLDLMEKIVEPLALRSPEETGPSRGVRGSDPEGQNGRQLLRSEILPPAGQIEHHSFPDR